ncbi:hypothetical protein CRC_03133 [Cylindrospermopsis raciborskii CS-505]|nr:hypothetical protein CRC_03133 [Cylindrospermopsis raciborskii CS-505]
MEVPASLWEVESMETKYNKSYSRSSIKPRFPLGSGINGNLRISKILSQTRLPRFPLGSGINGNLFFNCFIGF